MAIDGRLSLATAPDRLSQKRFILIHIGLKIFFTVFVKGFSSWTDNNIPFLFDYWDVSFLKQLRAAELFRIIIVIKMEIKL